MKKVGIPIGRYRINKSGKLERTHAHLDVSARLRMRGSKKVRVKRSQG